MLYYLDITLLPNAEVGIHFLWSKIYQQIHLGLVEIQDDDGRVQVGVAFPEYVDGEKFSLLGSKLRLFAGDEATLIKLDAPKWLARLSDYVHCTSIREVPAKVTGYAVYQRIQPKTSKVRLARRFAGRHNLDFATALAGYSALPSKNLAYPFIRLKSLSSEAEFCLVIRKTIVSEPVQAGFSSYGLSSVATVPEF